MSDYIKKDYPRDVRVKLNKYKHCRELCHKVYNKDLIACEGLLANERLHKNS